MKGHRSTSLDGVAASPNLGSYGSLRSSREGQSSGIGTRANAEERSLISSRQMPPSTPPSAPPLVPLPEHAFHNNAHSQLNGEDDSEDGVTEPSKSGAILFLVYGTINIIMCVPCLYGYASVIFNNDAYQPYINTLSKLVLWSSIVHQCIFSYFSGLNFSIGQVQDAGLIFLSTMANHIAFGILDEGGTPEEVVSTAIVILGFGTASMGVVLVMMGKYRLADAVAYLPLPVVGGYLAFIGFFCLEAGIALCISKSIVTILDWGQLFNKESIVLAFPGVIAGLVITYVSRRFESDAALPLVMISIPIVFYALIYLVPGYGLQSAREDNWVGQTSPPIPPQDVFKLIDIGKVKWEYLKICFPTWAGMVFVVSFSSCLDVAAISMDMGEALDTNKELITVGISNVVSGLLCGFTGSYIFSQTIFVYRTKCNTRWIGIITAVGELAVFLCTVNVLEVTPLFFLGATLIFIGFDLMYEWMVEVRHKLLLTEYCVLLATFGAIQVMGIDGGIFLGIIIAIVDYVVKTARVSKISRVQKRSRAVWKPEEWKILQDQGYHMQHPKIVTLEVKGNVFFGSSLGLLHGITDELSINATKSDRNELISLVASPRHHKRLTPIPRRDAKHAEEKTLPYRNSPARHLANRSTQSSQPLFVVLDLSQLSNLDASAARGCFLQLAKMCEKRGIVACGAGANTRVDWMLRSHDCAYCKEEEGRVKVHILSSVSPMGTGTAKLILFQTLYEALEFCEHKLIQKLEFQAPRRISARGSPIHRRQSLAGVFARYLGSDWCDTDRLKSFDQTSNQQYHDEIEFNAGDRVFSKGDLSDAFYVVLSGAVAAFYERGDDGQRRSVLSGAGVLPVPCRNQGLSEKSGARGQVKKYLKVGSIFGYVDFVLDQAKTFTAVAASDGTTIAKLHRTSMSRMKSEDPDLERLLEKVLLQASVLELSNVVET